MFLTTNRATTLDAAFESRIHPTLESPVLSEENRLKIWQTFVATNANISSYNSALAEEDLMRLAKIQINRRQIKDIVKTAKLLAKQKQRPLADRRRRADTESKDESAAS
ncbi:hypothetical protein BU25DRAFT_411857 [Macroventuria anomochaeta]|uniref:Uncharacterized protein n=1 Tax=Macroventuria anomochaeta TaxID=301207 RepID=A0ACB6RXN0_9PLEO|nr:uncharacterized protein BU25DRAFT_411857 [Macroventuria anomochaeta]KAF2626462.1 hypothetical protein BU25DRAFT_411857 [Macroventuria anomochaeta]